MMNILKQKNVKMIVPQANENEYLEHLEDSYLAVSEMTEEDRRFLNSLILRNRPKKLLEVGISAGSSSVIMLNALNIIGGGGGTLYSIDKSLNWYADNNKKTGFIVDNYPELKHRWKLFTGGLTCEFIEKIGDKIEFCLIDTAHINPGEILDFLMILPFLSKNALVVFHDTNLHTIRYPYHVKKKLFPNWPIEWFSYSMTNNLLMSSIHGESKIIVNDFIKKLNGEVFFGNIAGIRINSDTRKNIFNVFNLLSLKWQYNISNKEKLTITAFFQKYYDPFYVNYLDAIFEYHNLCFEYEETKTE
jgi:predicted O-methyltransferase YrrM